MRDAMINIAKKNQILLSLIPVIILAGCQSIRPSVDYVMKDLEGQKCRYQQSFAEQYKDFGTRQYEVYCDNWEHPSGHIFEFSIEHEKQISLQDWANSEAWRQWINKQMVCRTGTEDKVLKADQAYVLSCELLNGNWAYLALVVQMGSSVYLADGVTSIKPVLENFIGKISGRVDQPLAMTPDTRKRALRRIRDLVKGPIYSSREMKEYFRLMSAGQFYSSIKDHIASSFRYRKALELHKKIFGVNNVGAVDAQIHLALELSNQGKFNEAEILFKRARPLVFRSPDRSDLARYWSYRALHNANNKDFEPALEFARKATRIRKSLVSNFHQPGDKHINLENLARVDLSVLANIETPNLVDIVQSLYIEASMLERLKQYDDAEQTVRQAKSILLRTHEFPPSWEPEIEGLIARIAKAKGAEKERTRHLKTAADLWEHFAPGEKPSTLNYLKLGQAMKAQGKLKAAMRAFRRAIKLERVRNGSFSYDQLAPFFATALELTKQNVKKKHSLYAEMFTAGQLIKSKLTSQNIAMAVARLTEEVQKKGAGSVLRELQDAQDERYLLQYAYEAELSKFSEEKKGEKLKSIKTKLKEVNQRIRKMSFEVQAAFPRYNQLVDSVIDTKSLLSNIKTNEIVVQILLGANSGMVFAVSKEKIIAKKIEISSKEVEEYVSRLREGLVSYKSPFSVDLAYSLYKKLLGGIEKEIAGKHLITVVSGPLLSLPFGLLVTEDPGSIHKNNYRSAKWLIKSNPISLLPSVRSFVDLRNIKSQRAEKSFIGFGNFKPSNPASIYQLNSERFHTCQATNKKSISYKKMRGMLEKLPSTEKELLQVAKVFPENAVDLVFSSEFTDQKIKKMPLHQYQVLYFATHGSKPNELGCQEQPSLVTSLPPVLKGKNDGLLDMEEILKFRLNADLVVLSACNTGSAYREGGENLSGLARAFFFSGARSLLVSHWYAADKATIYLMTDFFNNLRKDKNIGLADALQMVQTSFIDSPVNVNTELEAEDEENENKEPYDFSHPFFWAIFTLVGDGKKNLVLDYSNESIAQTN